MIVQIYELLFKEKRKYNRGRLQCGDIRPNEESEKYSDDTKKDNNTVGAKNYRTRVSGLWVFGHCCKKKIF